MTKIVYSDYSSANQAASQVEGMSGVASGLASAIDGFASVTNGLEGKGYDVIRSKIQGTYQTCLENYQTVVSNLATCMIAANNAVANQMDGYAELDNTKLPEIEENLNTAKEKLAYCSEIVDKAIGYYTAAGKYKQITYREARYPQLIGLWQQQVNELTRYVKALRKVDPAVATGTSILAGAASDVGRFAADVASIDATTFDMNI